MLPPLIVEAAQIVFHRMLSLFDLVFQFGDHLLGFEHVFAGLALVAARAAHARERVGRAASQQAEDRLTRGEHFLVAQVVKLLLIGGQVAHRRTELAFPAGRRPSRTARRSCRVSGIAPLPGQRLRLDRKSGWTCPAGRTG